MKKIHNQLPGLILLTTLCFMLFSCSEKKETPEQTALNFFNLLYNKHDLEKAELLVTENSKEKLRNDFKFIEGALQIVEEKNPTKYEYSIAEQKTLIKNDSAFVVVNSSLDTMGMQVLLLHINDQWKIDLNYDAQLINAASGELVEDVLEIMEGFVDSVTVDNSSVTKTEQ